MSTETAPAASTHAPAPLTEPAPPASILATTHGGAGAPAAAPTRHPAPSARGRSRSLVAALSVVVVLAGAVPAAVADDREGTSVRVLDDGLLVRAGFRSDLRITGRPGPNGRRSITCGWFRLVIGSYPVITIMQVRRPVVGRPYLLYCWYGNRSSLVGGYPKVRVYRSRTLPGSPTTTAEVSRFAVRHLRFQKPVAVLNPSGEQIVGIPTWLALVSRVDYDPVSAAAGPVWASVRPVFRDVTFKMGNGDVVTCGPKAATTFWDPDNPTGRLSNCTYTFESNGDGDGSTRISVTARWTIWQRTNRRPREHRWGTFRRTAVVDVDVRELQSVID